MENLNTPNNFGYPNSEEDSISLSEIWGQIRVHKNVVIISTLVCFTIALLYAIFAKDIYQAKTVLKIEQPKGSILSGGMFDEIMNSQNDRYIANEIELLSSQTIREFVANTMIDSFNASQDTNNFYLIMNRDYFGDDPPSVKDKEMLVSLFSKKVDIQQKRGLDFIEITIESPSKKEAVMMANAYANVYLDYNLHENRRQLSNVTDFLKEQMDQRFKLLSVAEDTLKVFRLKAGVVELGAQAENLIATISDVETKRNTAEMELAIAKKTLNEYKGQLNKIDPTVSQYLDSKSDESYLTLLQQQIAELETQRDMAMTSSKNGNNKIVLDQYNNQIIELKSKLNNHIASYQEKIVSSSSPEEVKQLSQLIFEKEVEVQSLTASVKQLNKILSQYDSKFSNLPQATLELARLERNKIALEKLYVVLEEKYHEALINEQSVPGNVIIVDKARPPVKPAKPNRLLIVLIGLFLGVGLGVGYVYIKGFFNNKITTPEDVQRKNIDIIGWIPQFNGTRINTDFIVKENPKSIPSESYRAVRTRLQFAKEGKIKVKTILVTSALPSEGKTTSAVNIAGSFALADKKVLLIDCDLRKPRVHSLMCTAKIPGLTNYLNNESKLEDIIHKTETENLFFIPSGTIPSNPSEILGSDKIVQFIEMIREKVDIVVIDSAPLLPVTDTELLSKIVDLSVLVVSSGSTEFNAMEKAADILKNTKDNFAGALLNNFGEKYQNSSYYRYYYYYRHDDDKNKKSKRKIWRKKEAEEV